MSINSSTGARREELSSPIASGAVLLALAVFPVFDPDNYLLHVAALVFLYTSLGLGLNIVVGLAGLLDLGYAGFYAVGAYGVAVLTTLLGVPFFAAAVMAVAGTVLIGIILGWPTIRTSGDYLALVTLGFGEMIRLLMRNWVGVTNGPQGIMNVPAPMLGGMVVSTPVHYYYLGLLMGASTFLLFWRVKSSSAGLQLRAIRDDEGAAAAVGINPVRWKLYAFALGAAVAGMAGVFFASWQRFVSPESFTLNESILVLCIVVLGGMGKLWPTVASATFLVLLPEALRGLETYRALVLGILLVLVVVVQERLPRTRNQGPGVPTPRAKRMAESAEPDRPPESVAAFNPELPGQVLLAVSCLYKSFGGVRALHDFSMEVHGGEILGIVGANGAGKTTLFGCIAGSLQPDAGEIYWDYGHKRLGLNDLPVHERACLGLIQTFQQPRLFQSLTALQNVQLGAQCHKVPPLWAPLLPLNQAHGADQMNALLASAGVPTEETPVNRMSFVDQKRTELVRALAAKPCLLLVDEPAAGMEPAARSDLVHFLLRVNREMGIAIIVVEHDLNFLKSLCSRLLVLDRGRLVADGSPEDKAVLAAIRKTYDPKGGKYGVV